MRLIDADAILKQLEVDPVECPGCPEPEYLNEFKELLESAPSFGAEAIGTTLSGPRNKWFRDESGGTYHCKMAEVFGSYDSWTVWDSIRKLTCKIMGVSYVRQIKDPDKASCVAEAICQCIYDLGKEVRNE